MMADDGMQIVDGVCPMCAKHAHMYLLIVGVCVCVYKYINIYIHIYIYIFNMTISFYEITWVLLDFCGIKPAKTRLKQRTEEIQCV